MTLYHCNFSYVETDLDGSKPTVQATESWNYPNLERILKDINTIWSKENIPLVITEEKSERVRITHKDPLNIGSLAQLKLSGNLAYLLGYTSEITKLGQYLRFDENNTFLAPHKPNLFLNICETEEEVALQSIHKKKVKDLNTKMKFMAVEISELKQQKNDLENKLNLANTEIEKKWKFYAKQTIADNTEKLKLKCVQKLNEMEEHLKTKNGEECKKNLNEMAVKLKDARDRLEKKVLPIKDFNNFYDKEWMIKGCVSEGQMTRMGKDDNISKMYTMKITDYSGSLSITTFGKHAELLSKIYEDGMGYYVGNKSDPNAMTASINNNAFKITFIPIL